MYVCVCVCVCVCVFQSCLSHNVCTCHNFYACVWHVGGWGEVWIKRYIVANNMIYQSMSYILTPDLHLSKLGVTPLCMEPGVGWGAAD